MGYHLDITRFSTQIFEEFKTNLQQIEDNLYNLSYKLRLCKNKKRSPILFTNPHTSPTHLKRLVGIEKPLPLENQSPSRRNLFSFSVPLRYKYSTLSSLRTEGHLFKMQTSGGHPYQKGEKGGKRLFVS